MRTSMGGAPRFARVIRMNAGRSRVRMMLWALCLAGAAMAAPGRTCAEAPSGAARADAGAAASQGTSHTSEIENRTIRRSGSPRVSGSGGPAEAPVSHTSGSWWMWLQTLGILGVVLAVMGLALRWLRKAGLGRSFGGSTATIQILSRGYLTNKHQMVLVRFGERILLVGVGPQSLGVLSEVRDPAEAAQILARMEGGKPGSISQDFLQTIDSAAQQYGREAKMETDLVEPPVAGAGTPQIGTLRQELRSLLARMQSMGRK